MFGEVVRLDYNASCCFTATCVLFSPFPLGAYWHPAAPDRSTSVGGLVLTGARANPYVAGDRTGSAATEDSDP